MTIFIQSHDVAEMIGMTSAAAFLRARPRLEEDEAFPLPVPTSLRPMLWRREAIAAWVERQGLPEPVMFEEQLRQAGPNVVLMREAARP